MSEKYFYDHLSRVLDYYSKNCYFNSEPNDEHIHTFRNSYNLQNLVTEKTCFKGPPKCYDLILTNWKYNFQNTLVLTSGFSDFHKMTVTVLNTEFVKADPVQINYRDYRIFNVATFNEDFKNALNIRNDSSKNYYTFQTI